MYVNYGRPDDYEVLERRGVSVKGAIVIARYGGSWRGIKPKVAAEHGAIGCLIYSDPRDDGYAAARCTRGPDAQRGRRAARQRDGHARAPRRPAHPWVRRHARREAAGCQGREDAHQDSGAADSYGDAQPLLAALGGPLVPADWRGALPITYRIGPGPATVHLKVAFEWDIKRLYNVIARIPGSTFPTSGSSAATTTTHG